MKKLMRFVVAFAVLALVATGCQKEENDDLLINKTNPALDLTKNAFGYKQILGDLPLKHNHLKIFFDGPTVYDKAGNAYETFFFDNGTIKQTWIKRNYADSKVSTYFNGTYVRTVFAVSSAIKTRPGDANGQTYGRYFEYKSLLYGVPAKPPIVLFKDQACTQPINGWRLPKTSDIGYVISEAGGAEYVSDPDVLNIQIYGHALFIDGASLTFSSLGNGDGMFWLTDKPNPNPDTGFNRWLACISTYVQDYPYPTIFFSGQYDYKPPYAAYHFYANIRLVLDDEIL